VNKFLSLLQVKSEFNEDLLDSQEKGTVLCNEEDSMFSLLYQQCLKPEETSVDVYDVLEFVQSLQQGEEIFDSQESVS